MRRRTLWLWSFLPILLAISLARLFVCRGESAFEEYDYYGEDDLEEHIDRQPSEEDDYALPEMEFIQDDRGPQRVRFQDYTGEYHVFPIPPHLLDLPEDEMMEETMLFARNLYPGQHQYMDEYDLMEEARDYLHPSDRRQRERTILTLFFHSVKGGKKMREGGRWLDEYTDYCDWSGISCGVDERDKADYVLLDYEDGSSPPPDDTVTKIDLPGHYLSGTLPTELAMLDHLQILDLSTNRLRGTIPEHYVYLTQLRALDLSYNFLTGSMPKALGTNCLHMEAVSLTANQLTGPLPLSMNAWTDLWYFDIGRNSFTGTISSEIGLMTKMQTMFVSDNLLTGTIPSELNRMTAMRLFDAGSNALTGTLPRGMKALAESLWEFNVADNILWGHLPLDILGLTNAQLVILSDNMFSGTIPPGDDVVEGRPLEGREPVGMKWSNIMRLNTLKLDKNELTGPIPADFLYGLRSTVDTLDLSFNHLTGTIATEIGQMSALGTIDIMSNKIRGTVPNEMLKLNKNLRLNFTDNLFTGTIPGMFCGEGAASMSMLYQENGCDAVLCRPGTFNTYGHATLYASCRACPTTEEGEKLDPPMSTVLGRTECNGTTFIHGDLNADGTLSAREILRLIYVENLGRFWGAAYQSWANMRVGECDLSGVTCVEGKIHKIDLSAANLCSNGDRKPGPIVYCKGLPAEIGGLSTLEILQVSRRQFLRGTLPTEIGKLSLLKFLDFSSCTSMKGNLPTELGLLTNLRYLILSHSRFQGTFPEEIFHIRSLEKIHITNNRFYGSLPTTLGLLENLKEFMLSRNYFTSSIPTEIGRLSKLENFEAYSNSMNGSLPEQMAVCTNLKRIDVFNNQLTGTIPGALSNIKALQILHIKNNLITGTIPSMLGELPYLSWFDASHNHLYGTIPASFGTSRSIKDFRLANNMIYDPVPQALCANLNVNGGLTKQYGCDGVICSLGSYSDIGHATDADGGCKPCPEGETNLYLGSTTCRIFSFTEIMSLFFDVMNGDSWPASYRTNWRDLSVDSCSWAGIVCDESGEPISLTFPLKGTDDGSAVKTLPRWQK